MTASTTASTPSEPKPMTASVRNWRNVSRITPEPPGAAGGPVRRRASCRRGRGPRGRAARPTTPGRGSDGRSARRACSAGRCGSATMTCWSPGRACAVATGAGQSVVGREQLVDLAGDLDPRVDEHDQVVADPLEVGDQVGGEHHAHAVLGDDLHQALEELAPCERIEARDGLVEHEQLRPLRDREGEGELGALAARELARLLARVEPEPRRSGPRRARRPSPGSARRRTAGGRRPTAPRRSGCPGRRSRRGRAGPASSPGRPPRTVIVPAVGRRSPTDEVQQRRLAGAVGPDEPDDLAGRDGERALRERPRVARSACRGRSPRRTAVTLRPPRRRTERRRERAPRCSRRRAPRLAPSTASA